MFALVACLLTCYVQQTGLSEADCTRKARLGDIWVYTPAGREPATGYRFKCVETN